MKLVVKELEICTRVDVTLLNAQYGTKRNAWDRAGKWTGTVMKMVLFSSRCASQHKTK